MQIVKTIDGEPMSNCIEFCGNRNNNGYYILEENCQKIKDYDLVIIWNGFYYVRRQKLEDSHPWVKILRGVKGLTDVFNEVVKELL